MLRDGMPWRPVWAVLPPVGTTIERRVPTVKRAASAFPPQSMDVLSREYPRGVFSVLRRVLAVAQRSAADPRELRSRGKAFQRQLRQAIVAVVASVARQDEVDPKVKTSHELR